MKERHIEEVSLEEGLFVVYEEVDEYDLVEILASVKDENLIEFIKLKYRKELKEDICKIMDIDDYQYFVFLKKYEECL